MSVASARAELESDSSSLLRSIYGSQVSQVLLASDDSNTSLLGEGTWAQERTGRSFVRPKSSPAPTNTRTEKENQQRSNLQSQPNLTSNSAPRRTTRALQRPATARVSAHVGGGAGRPISAVSCKCYGLHGGTSSLKAYNTFIAALSSTVGRCGGGGRHSSQS